MTIHERRKKKKHVQRYQNQLKVILQHFPNSIYSHFKLPAAILDAILKVAAFWEVHFGRLLVFSMPNTTRIH